MQFRTLLLLAGSVAASANTYTSLVCGSGSNNIPDGTGTLSCIITVNDSGSIASGNAVTVALLGLQHEASGDLVATLTHFTDSSQTSMYGSPQYVFYRIGKMSADPNDFGYSAEFGDSNGTGDNYDFGSAFPGGLWATAASLGAANFIPGRAEGFINGYATTGSFSSAATTFSAMFAGQPLAGVWRLDVADVAAGPTMGSTGSLLQWQLALVNGPPPPAALSIAKMHTGNFTQGQQNATYTATVSNAANAGPTSGTVTATETVPSGLNFVSMAGMGWTCPGTAANNCTRSDALNGGASYPPITVTVNVAANATSPQVNMVGVSGGGSAVANASDSTNIVVPAPATITSPANGSTLPGSSVNFQWTTGTGVTQYWLSISKVGVGGGELFNADPGPGLVMSKTIGGLPTDGSTIYVRLYSHIGTGWPSVDYTYTTAGAAPAPATITSPANGSTLPGSSVNFQWTTGTGVTQYWLSISKVGVGGGDLYNADPGPGLVTSKTISGLPTDGSTVYVRLYSHIGTTWPSIDYTYTAAGAAPAPANITNPANGSTLPGASVNFQWTNGTGVAQYWLSVSKVSVGGGDLYNADPGPGPVTSKTISGLPTDGSTIYVRLYSHIGTTWPSVDYIYTAAGPATITSPLNGSTLPGASVNFQWTTGTGVSQYWLSISKVGVGGGELYNADPGPGLVTSKTISGLPTDGSTIYVRLYSHIGSNWPSRDYTYTAFH